MNHALGIVDADLFAILDADHVAHADFLLRTLGYFRDPRSRSCRRRRSSTTSRASSTDSGPHVRRALPRADALLSAPPAGQEPMERRVLVRHERGRARDRAARRRRLRDRDDHRGHPHHDPLPPARLASVYHNEVLARGLAADDAAQYQLQRNRWGTGAMQVLRIENPLVLRGTAPSASVVAYAATLLGWFDAWRTLGFLILPPAVLLTGKIPIVADGLHVRASSSASRTSSSSSHCGGSAAARTGPSCRSSSSSSA